MANSTPLLCGITRKIMMMVPSSCPWKKDGANLLSSSFLKLPSLPSRNISFSLSCSSVLPLLLLPPKDLTGEEEYAEADEEEDRYEEADKEDENEGAAEEEYNCEDADDGEEENQYKTANFCFYSPVVDKFVNVQNRCLPPKLSNAVCRGSSNGWLAFINRPDCGIYLVNLFSPDPQIIPLPHIKTLLLGKTWLHWIKPYAMSDQDLGKLVMSSSPKVGEDCKVLFINNLLTGDIAFCMIGDMVWTSLGFSGITDILYSKKNQLFYALNLDEKIHTVDLSNPVSLTSIENDVKYLPASIPLQVQVWFFFKRDYLVESPEGDLLYVVRYFVNSDWYDDDDDDDDDDFRHDDDDSDDDDDDDFRLLEHHEFQCYKTSWGYDPPYRTTWFTVYKVDFKNQIGEPMESLDDAVLFVRCGDSFSLSAKDYPGLRPNSIYFDFDLSDSVTFLENKCSGGRDTGVYNLEKHTITPMYHPSESMEIGEAPLWVFSRL